MDAGISPSLFWELSIQEVYDLIDSYNRRTINNLKQKALNNRILADQIIRGMTFVLNGKDCGIENLQIWDYYPGLFEDEKEKYQSEERIKKFVEFKSRRKRFANMYNMKYEGDGD